MKKIKFIVADTWKSLRSTEERPFFGLVKKTWDDFGNKTLHTLFYFGHEKKEWLIGEVKIMRLGTVDTKLRSSFTTLSDDWISLGQALEYYENLNRYAQEDGEAALLALNDVSWRPTLAEPHEHEPAFVNSLTRTNEAKTSFQFGRNAYLKKSIPKNYAFKYTLQSLDLKHSLKAVFNFRRDEVLPWRVCAMIGKNGVGKTQLLAALARDLVQQHEISLEDRELSQAKFSPAMPIFSRVIALSFSAFDRFERPKESPHVSYFYCGAMNAGGKANEDQMQRRFTTYRKKILLLKRSSEFARIVLEILHGPDTAPERINPDEAEEIINSFDLRKVSSGQGLATFAMAGILAHIRPNSLILFDEPELHLHPNAIACLMRVIHRIADSYESFAILATHSPLVVREIPKRNVLHLEKVGELVQVFPLHKESLGEDVAELTRTIFETKAIRSTYMDVLTEMAKDYTFDEALEYFDGKLSINATAFLAAQYPQKKSSKNKK